MVDKSILHSLESAVIEWSHQIRAVLKKDSSEALLEGRNPTPHTELLFWQSRSAPRLSPALTGCCLPAGPQSSTASQIHRSFVFFSAVMNNSGPRTSVPSTEKCNLELCARSLFLRITSSESHIHCLSSVFPLSKCRHTQLFSTRTHGEHPLYSHTVNMNLASYCLQREFAHI